MDAGHVRSALRYPDGACDEQCIPIIDGAYAEAVVAAVTTMQDWVARTKAARFTTVVVACPMESQNPSVLEALSAIESITVRFVDFAEAQWAYLEEIGAYTPPGNVILHGQGDQGTIFSLIDPAAGECLARAYDPTLSLRTIDDAIASIVGTRARIDHLRHTLIDRESIALGRHRTIDREDVARVVDGVAQRSFRSSLDVAHQFGISAESIVLLGTASVLVAPIARNYRSVPLVVAEDPTAIAAIGAAVLLARTDPAAGGAPVEFGAGLVVPRSADRRARALGRNSLASRGLTRAAAVIALLATTGLGIHLTTDMTSSGSASMVIDGPLAESLPGQGKARDDVLLRQDRTSAEKPAPSRSETAGEGSGEPTPPGPSAPPAATEQAFETEQSPENAPPPEPTPTEPVPQEPGPAAAGSQGAPQQPAVPPQRPEGWVPAAEPAPAPEPPPAQEPAPAPRPAPAPQTDPAPQSAPAPAPEPLPAPAPAPQPEAVPDADTSIIEVPLDLG
ncbi:hypothetical protein [Lolliginicoccus levis]|uniref:hypothetical protein n=1 Tax=Lolliginicoccus levis TaxID=2919542 RepID=UPI00241D0341|nr:hypothetical protein [Lolliginicoccus levis]